MIRVRALLGARSYKCPRHYPSSEPGARAKRWGAACVNWDGASASSQRAQSPRPGRPCASSAPDTPRTGLRARCLPPMSCCLPRRIAPLQMLQQIWRGLAAMNGAERPCSTPAGRWTTSALRALAEAGAATGTIHPMQTFSGQSTPDLAGTVFGIDGSPAAQKVARKMIRQMGGVAVRLSGANKAAYHAAGTFACAHVLALMEAATRLLMSQGFKRRQATRALLTLTRQTLDNLERIGPRAAWTGPLTRGDFTTVKRHVDALSDFPPEYLDAYKALSRLTAAVLSDDSRRASRETGRHRWAASHRRPRRGSQSGTQSDGEKAAQEIRRC